MKIIFFGLGSIGQRHANILLKNYKHDLYAFRSGINDLPNSLGIKELHSWNEVKKLNPDIAFITNPTSLHIETAIKCAEIGCKPFIEKPIGSNLKRLDELIKIVREKKMTTYIAYNMRFHPVITYLKKFISTNKPLHLRVVCTSYYPNWRKNRDHLKVYSASSKMGGGVILDLSHELDYVYFLLGDIKKITGGFGKRGNVTIDTEDYADVLINTEKAPVNIHLNFLSQILQRYIQIDFKNFTIIGDLINSQILEYKNEKLDKTLKLKYYTDLPYEQQIKYFFDNIENPNMMNNLYQASNLFKKIVEFKNG